MAKIAAKENSSIESVLSYEFLVFALDINDMTKNRIEGFEWYLPLAFKECVAQCKFEQGDLIFRDEPVGENWGERKGTIEFMIQVKLPTRQVSNAGGDLDIFDSNWNSKVVFEKIYPNDPTRNKIFHSTQGRLFTYFWKNEEEVLLSENPLPPLIRTFTPPQFDLRYLKSQIPSGWYGFAFLFDSVSNISIAKRNAIQAALSPSFHFEMKTCAIQDAIRESALGQNRDSIVCPTLKIKLFLIKSSSLTEVDQALRNALFKGKKENWSVGRHGLIILA